MPTRIRKRIDAIDAKYGPLISVVIGSVMLGIAVAVAILALQIKSTGDTTATIAKANAALIAEVQAGRFVNTQARCDQDNETNGRIRKFVIAAAGERARVGVTRAFPRTSDCELYAFKKVCIGKEAARSARCKEFAEARHLSG